MPDNFRAGTWGPGFRRVPEKIPAFEANTASLAWLENFASIEASGRASSEDQQSTFPWFWNPAWGDTVDVGIEGAKTLKHAVEQTECMVKSLESFLLCSKDRLTRLKTSLKSVATKAYFPFLTDDVLAIIFEFAASGELTGKLDYRTPARISRVSRRFREIALRLPFLWRFLDSGSQTVEIARELASRTTGAGPMLDVGMRLFDVMASNSGKYGANWQEEVANEHIVFFSSITTSLSSRIASLHFMYDLEYDFIAVERMNTQFNELSLPALQELQIDHRDPAFDGQAEDPNELYLQFFRNWDLPALRVLKAKNIIPRLQSDVVARLTECSISLGRHLNDPDNTGEWQLSALMTFLRGLSAVKVLTVDLHGERVAAGAGKLATVTLPSVETLTTSFVGVKAKPASRFRRAFKTPNKKIWTIEMEDNPLHWPFWKQIDDIIDIDPYRQANDNHALKEINLIINRDFGREDCGSIAYKGRITRFASNIENFSVTYPKGEQGFFSKKDMEPECTVQVRKIVLKNCKGNVDDLLESLEEKFIRKSYNGDSCLVLDGKEVQESRSSYSSGAPTWSSLVRDAEITREE
ncbi:hypothetical protein SCHPADRAFT_937739 [Schizopora paradoxa]|uniref:F-box domain-containing protein n=1 Tax=Schizopora paradoxa TaxID=27342 RepID=A0A0H2RY88_9AGAM|nr:hypothetical protein SCHPADRAFT_937739 [Schizopora paradoxa]